MLGQNCDVMFSFKGATCAELWAVCLRSDINHRDDNTTALCEGYHHALKSLMRELTGEGQRVDKFIHFLLDYFAEQYTFRDEWRTTSAHHYHSCMLRALYCAVLALCCCIQALCAVELAACLSLWLQWCPHIISTY